MSGPIVRTGTNPKFWSNWDKAFGNKKPAAAGKSSAKSADSKATDAKAAKPKAAKPKAAKPKAAKKK